jgi:hypothetical protein
MPREVRIGFADWGQGHFLWPANNELAPVCGRQQHRGSSSGSLEAMKAALRPCLACWTVGGRAPPAEELWAWQKQPRVKALSFHPPHQASASICKEHIIDVLYVPTYYCPSLPSLTYAHRAHIARTKPSIRVPIFRSQGSHPPTETTTRTTAYCTGDSSGLTSFVGTIHSVVHGSVAVWNQAGPGSARCAGVRETLGLSTLTIVARRAKACTP